MNTNVSAVVVAAAFACAPLFAQVAPTPSTPPTASPATPPATAPGDVVVLSAFSVNADADTGYKATNSVSATRMAIAISDIPMNISAFTEEFIQDQKAYDLYDIVKWAPGVHQDNISPQGWARYNIRGFTSSAVQRNGFGSFRFIDTTNIERVEVIKGPASLLYGQINPGGVINYVTKRPETKQSVGLDFGIGTDDYTRVAIDATGPIPGTGGKLLYRAIGMREDVQVFQSIGSAEKYMFSGGLTWNIAPTTALTVDYEHFERLDKLPTSGVPLLFVNGVGTIQYPGLPWDFSYAGDGDYQNFISDAITVELTSKIGQHLNLRAAYLDSTYDMDWRATGQGGTGLIAQSFIDFYYPASAGLTSKDAMFRRNRWEHQWGGERTGQIDLAGDFTVGGVRLRPLVGYKENFESPFRGMQKNNPNVAGSPYYIAPWDLRNPATWNRAVPFEIQNLLLSADTESNSTSNSLYGVLSASAFNDRLLLLGGYARHELHNDPTVNYLAGTRTAPSDRSANVPQAGGMWKFSKELSVFVSYSESFLANTSMLRVDNVPVRAAAPSVGQSTEGGLKFDLMQGRISGTLSVYNLKASPTGIITITSGTDPNGNTLFTDVQGGTQRSEGFEFDLLYTPVNGVQVMLNYAYCDAVYEKHPSSAALDGTRLVATPDNMANLWGKYTVRSGPCKDFMFSAGINYVGSLTYVGNNPLVEIGSRTTADVALGYSFNLMNHRWTADLAVKNVTDEEYYESASSWGFPRRAILSLSTKF